MKEGAVTSRVLLAAADDDVMLWRNNNGAFKDARGIPVRYGLGNVSAELNKVWKSSDYIGIQRVLITPDMVGTYIGTFVAAEMKPDDWFFDTNDERACAQLKFIDTVRRYGGRADFVRSIPDYKRLVKL